MGWQELERPEKAQPQALESLYPLSDDVWVDMSHVSWRNTIEVIVNHLNTYFPEEASQHADFHQWVDEQGQQEYQKGFTSEQDLLQYFNVIACVGDIESLKDQYPDIDELIQKPSQQTPSQQTPSQRIEKAAEMAWNYNQSTIKGQVQ